MAEPTGGLFHLISEHWETLLGLGGAAAGSVAFVWYTLKRTIPDLISRIGGIEQTNGEAQKQIRREIEEIRNGQDQLDRRVLDLGYAKRRDFYDEKGMPLFQLRTGCLEMRGDCSKERADLKHDICKKMEEVKVQVASNVNAIHETLNEQAEEASRQAEKIKDILSRVERVVEKDRQTERREEMRELVEALGDKIADSIVGRIKDAEK
jgi:uncharacterized Zn finger protein (UPF0148 family)